MEKFKNDPEVSLQQESELKPQENHYDKLRRLKEEFERDFVSKKGVLEKVSGFFQKNILQKIYIKIHFTKS